MGVGESAETVTKTDLDMKRLPGHVAIIMDGNGRWAKKNGVTRLHGHDKGAQSVRKITEVCREMGGIESLTLYAFSTENWRRSEREVKALFRLLSKYIKLEVENLHKENIRVRFMGRKDGLSTKLLEEMSDSEEKTRDNTAMILNLAVNYGSRGEIVDACKSIAADVLAGRLSESEIDEDLFADHLYVPEVQDVDLLVRTGGEMRLSNFMLWQLSYSEIVVTDTLWPEFHKEQMLEALREYQSRTRNFGGRK
ncbi:MAG: isoprenyl transferase [Candidatus Hydrogenedentota bacterium]